MGVNPKIGGNPPKWMAKIMENPIKMDDLGGFPIVFGNTQIGVNIIKCLKPPTSAGFHEHLSQSWDAKPAPGRWMHAK